MPDGEPKTLTIKIGASLKAVEKQLIEATLRYTGGNVSASAKILGIDRSTLHKKINEYKLED